MVVLSIKTSNDGDGFLYETTAPTPILELIPSLVNIYNGRLRARTLVDAVGGLAAHGIMKPVDDIGSDEFKKSCGVQTSEEENYCPDPSGLRTGNRPDPGLASTLLQTASSLDEYINKSQVIKKVALTEEGLNEKLSNVRGAVIMAFPMGLPKWDTVKLLLDGNEALKETGIANDILDPDTASLWIDGKEFPRDNLVSDRLGNNEKTKVIGKLQKSGGGPPAREPAVSEKERKAMMAHYFKRNEELKNLAEADDDDYLRSSWADPKSMKRGLHGLNDVRMRM